MHNKTKELWNKLADWWDESYQEGDIFHRTFLFPTFIKWTAATKGMRILDIGCGNGALARLFAKIGASVVAADFSEVFIDKAKQRSKGLSIDYQVIDATDESQLNTLADAGKFDRIISSMVLHDMSTITPLMASLPKLLAPKGKFIFSVPHPCFNSGLVEIEHLKKHMDQNQLLLPNRYIKPETFEIFSKPDQPVKQICFHRPLSMLFNELFSVGFVMSGFVEPIAKIGELPEDFLWAKLSEIPPAIISCWEIKK
ncbi:MAG: type 11 methyltransferase [uncultured bacterium]|nr:MAG: type 11 methyltransferase [uncultured bacterium]